MMKNTRTERKILRKITATEHIISFKPAIIITSPFNICRGYSYILAGLVSNYPYMPVRIRIKLYKHSLILAYGSNSFAYHFKHMVNYLFIKLFSAAFL